MSSVAAGLAIQTVSQIPSYQYVVLRHTIDLLINCNPDSLRTTDYSGRLPIQLAFESLFIEQSLTGSSGGNHMHKLPRAC
jgi:hypothetical protein